MPEAAGAGPIRRPRSASAPGSPPWLPGSGDLPSASESGEWRHSSSSQAVSRAALPGSGEAGVAALSQSLPEAAGDAVGVGPAPMAGPEPDAPASAAPRRTRSCITEQMRLGAASRLRTGQPALRQRSSSRDSTRSSPLRPARASRSRTVRSISSKPVSSRAKDASPAMPAESSSGRSAHLRTTHSPLPAWLSARRISASSPLRARRIPAPGALTRPSPQALPGRWEPGRAIPPARRR